MKLKNLIIISFIFIASMILNSGCSNDHHDITKPDKPGRIPILMNLQPAYDYGFDVTRVSVTITKDDFTETQDMILTPPTAHGTFTDLLPGLYSISVSVYQDTLLIATGVGQGEVIPGQSSAVNITLHLVTGALIITVDWGTTIPLIPQKILFIGNSHTYYNGGVDVHVQGMANAAHPEWDIHTSQITVGGATLENHLSNPTTINTISTGNYDLVILQEQSSRPVDAPALFYQSVTEFDSLISLSGAQTGLYMTHGWQSRPTMIDSVAYAYTYIGAQLGALVCPAGLAWKHAMEVDDHVQLYDFDGLHPNQLGTYLSSCVIYASIWHVSPIGNSYISSTSITEKQKLFAQTMAWETVCSYFGWPTGK
jgi:hypothetical protein